MELDRAVRRELDALAEPSYRTFQAALLPGVPHILGVRLPKLRALARRIAKNDWQTWLSRAESDTFEETMLQGMVIGCVDAPLEERLRFAAAFIPRIDNWSVCDSFCASLKCARAAPAAVWPFLPSYARSEREFEARFAAVMLLNYYISPTWMNRTLALLHEIRQEDYYAQMAVAWALSLCYAKAPEQTARFLEEAELTPFVRRKTLQKIRESRLCRGLPLAAETERPQK